MMLAIGIASFVFMIIPVYLGVIYLSFTVTQAWFCVLTFIGALFLIVFFRYRQGKWQDMLVIERDTK